MAVVDLARHAGKPAKTSIETKRGCPASVR